MRTTKNPMIVDEAKLENPNYLYMYSLWDIRFDLHLFGDTSEYCRKF